MNNQEEQLILSLNSFFQCYKCQNGCECKFICGGIDYIMEIQISDDKKSATTTVTIDSGDGKGEIDYYGQASINDHNISIPLKYHECLQPGQHCECE